MTGEPFERDHWKILFKFLKMPADVRLETLTFRMLVEKLDFVFEKVHEQAAEKEEAKAAVAFADFLEMAAGAPFRYGLNARQMAFLDSMRAKRGRGRLHKAAKKAKTKREELRRMKWVKALTTAMGGGAGSFAATALVQTGAQ
eukprot:9818570-Heterocapsa_arctica.AAC.1